MTVRGTAVDTRGRAVAGLRVEVELGAIGTAEGVTDDRGAFELAVDPPPRGTAALVRCWVGDRLVHVQDAVIPAVRLPSLTLEVVEPFEERRRLFGRVLANGKPVPGATVAARDGSGVHGPQEALSGRGGRLTLLYDAGRSSPVLWLTVAVGGATLVSAEAIEWAEPELEADIEVAPAAAMQVAGRVVERGGAGVAGVVVELLDRAMLWPNPVGSSDETTASGEFGITFSRLLEPPPLPTLRAVRRGVAIGSMDADPAWRAGVLRDVALTVAPAEELPASYRLDGQALDRSSRAGVPGLRVEVWTAGFATMLGAAGTDAEGRFAVAFAAASATEEPRLAVRVYDGWKLLAQVDALDVSWSPLGEAVTFVEVDGGTIAPRSFHVSGRVLDTATHAGLPGLRVEAWDRLPRDGGVLGVAAETAVDGSFQLNLPPPAAPGPELVPRRSETGLPVPIHRVGPTFERLAPATTPSVFFRVYANDRLVATLNPPLTWTPDGATVTVLEIPAPTESTSTEVGLHELGENLASTVDRVQHELARYPGSMGAYVLDEIDLELPVDLRVDQLGQVRTRVLDSSTATDRAVGRVHMRVKPVLGAAARPTDVPDQPLVVLEELSTEAIRKLGELRIYSVEDLVRAAQSGGGRAALVALDLDVDLDVLLAKAGLLALPTLPRAVREALLGLGLADISAFLAVADPEDLAARLTAALGQEIAANHVVAWQDQTRKYLAVPLPENTPE